MRVILTNNIPKLGEVGDVCEVKAGYGRNYLLPQGLAIAASSGALKQISDLRRTEERRQNRVRSATQDFAKRLERLDLVFTAKVGQTGRLYGSITSSDIADRVEELIGEEIDRRKIMLDESIRSLGEHEVPVHLMPGVDAHLKVMVQPDGELVEDLELELDESMDGEGDSVAEAEASGAVEAVAEEEAPDIVEAAAEEEAPGVVEAATEEDEALQAPEELAETAGDEGDEE
jgi:large subunit ribosomal protein L9